MENNKNAFPFVFTLVLTICSLLVLGWSFGFTSGYGLVTTWSNFCLSIAAIFQILSLIFIFLILVVSIWGWAYTLGKMQEIRIGKHGMKEINEILFSIYVCLAVFVFLFSSIGFGGVTFGSVLYLVLVIGAYVTYLIFRGNGLISKNGLFEKLEKEEDKPAKKKTKRKNNTEE